MTKPLLSLLAFCSFSLSSLADVVPQGTPVRYAMNAQLVGVDGFAPAAWVASKVSYSDDGADAYISGFFPLEFPCTTSAAPAEGELWVHGRADATSVTIDCSEVALTLKTDNGGEIALKMGEITLDKYDNPVSVSDVTLSRDGQRIFLKDNAAKPSHILGLYYTHDDVIYLYSRMACPDLRPYEGHVDLVEVPATAEVKSYVYHTQKWYGAKDDHVGRVAVAGDDYYFDSLLPDVGRSWVKGTRKGNTITLFNDQYLGISNGFYVYYFGNLVTGIDYENMVNIEEFAELTFSIDSKGNIKLNNPTKANPGAYLPDGGVFGAAYNHTLEPYENSDVALVPSAPYDISVGDEYLDVYGGYVLDFLQDNLSVDGKYLEPSKLGYYIYLDTSDGSADPQPFTFRRDEYPYIDADEMTLVPYGYRDFYDYDFNHQANMNEVYIYRTDWKRIGVQSVYTNAGETKTSPIVYATLDRADGIAAPVSSSSSLPAYDLSGRRVSPAHRGISIVGGKIIIR